MKRVIDNLKGDEPPVYDDSITSKNNDIWAAERLICLTVPAATMTPCLTKPKLGDGIWQSQRLALATPHEVGYASRRLLDEMEEAGIVGPADGAKPREVFMEHFRPTEADELPGNRTDFECGRRAVFDDEVKEEKVNTCHCEEWSDEAIPLN